MVPIGHANDGGGSIRIPASCCGLVGLKPSRGAGVAWRPTFGDVDVAASPTELVVSRSVRDTAAVLECVSEGRRPASRTWRPRRRAPYAEEVGADPGRLRIGLLTTPPGGQFDGRTPSAWPRPRTTARLLESLGHSVEAAYPAALDDEGYIPQFLVRWTARRATGTSTTGRAGPAARSAPDDVEPLTWALAEMGRTHTARPSTSRAVEYAQVVTRAVPPPGGRRLRPAAHADAGAAAAAARLLRRRRRRTR